MWYYQPVEIARPTEETMLEFYTLCGVGICVALILIGIGICRGELRYWGL